MDKLVGTSRSLTILQFTKEHLLDSQCEGWTGMLLLTDGKSTFSQDQTTFIRVRSPRVASPVARHNPIRSPRRLAVGDLPLRVSHAASCPIQ